MEGARLNFFVAVLASGLFMVTPLAWHFLDLSSRLGLPGYEFLARQIVPSATALVYVVACARSGKFRQYATAGSIGTGLVTGLAFCAEIWRLSGSYSGNEGLLGAMQFYHLPTAAGGALSFFASIALAVFAVRGSWVNSKGREGPVRGKDAAYGDAEFMTMKEAKEVFPAGGGIVLGEAYIPSVEGSGGDFFDPRDKSTWGEGGKHELLCFDGNTGSGHGLVFCGSGGYKTTSLVVPSALNWEGSLVCLDPSVEVGAMVSAHRGQRVVALNPNDPERGFNLLGWIKVNYVKLPQDGKKDRYVPSLLKNNHVPEQAASTVKWLMGSDSKSSGNDEFFKTLGAQLITGVIVWVLTTPTLSDSERSLATVRSIIAVDEKEFKNWLASECDTGSVMAFVKDTFRPFKSMADQTFSGVFANAAKETQWLAYANYASMVSCTEPTTKDGVKLPVVTPLDIVSGDVDFYINIDLAALRSHPGMARAIVGSLLNAAYVADGAMKKPCLFMLDEAATMGGMEIISTARDAGRKYGIRLCLIYQSMGQLMDCWGQHARSAWFESTSYRLFAALNDDKTAKEVSDICGEYTMEVNQKSVSKGTSGQSFELFKDSSSANVTNAKQKVKRQLILPQEVMLMRGDEQIVFVTGRPPLRSGRAIYFRRPEMLAKLKENRFSAVPGEQGEQMGKKPAEMVNGHEIVVDPEPEKKKPEASIPDYDPQAEGEKGTGA